MHFPEIRTFDLFTLFLFFVCFWPFCQIWVQFWFILDNFRCIFDEINLFFLGKRSKQRKQFLGQIWVFLKFRPLFLCPCLQWITNQFFMWVVIQFFSQVWSFADRGVKIFPTKKRKWRFYRWHSAYFMSYWHLKRPGVIWILAKKQFGGKIIIRSPVFLTFLNFAA